MQQVDSASQCDALAPGGYSAIHAMAAVTTAIGAMRVNSWACRAGMPNARAARAPKRRISHRPATADSPMTAVVKCGSADSAFATAPTSSASVLPLMATPSSCGNCPIAITMDAPVMNPCRTGALSRAAKTSRRSSVAVRKTAAISSASTIAARCTVTPCAPATGITACAVIMANTATGPTARVVLDPNAA